LDELVGAGLLPANFEEKLRESYVIIAQEVGQETFRFRALPVRPGLPVLEVNQSLEVRPAGTDERSPPPPPETDEDD